MSMISNLDLIRRVPLFSLLTPDQALTVAENVIKRRYRRGEVMVEQGHKSDELIILLTGRARVLTSDQRGREVILAVLKAGDYVGEMSMIDNEPHSAFFERCLPENASLAYAVMHGLVRRLRHANRQIESLALLDVYGRVAGALLNMSEVEDGIRLINRRVNRQDVAKIVGASREMVSRVMKDLEERGAIQTRENGMVVIRDHLIQG